jgi:hypothetical protein
MQVYSIVLHAANLTPTALYAYLVNILLAGQGMAPQLKSAIDTLIESNQIVVFMKGTKQFPQCGFSNTVVQVGGGWQCQLLHVTCVLQGIGAAKAATCLLLVVDVWVCFARQQQQQEGMQLSVGLGASA